MSMSQEVQKRHPSHAVYRALHSRAALSPKMPPCGAEIHQTASPTTGERNTCRTSHPNPRTSHVQQPTRRTLQLRYLLQPARIYSLRADLPNRNHGYVFPSPHGKLARQRGNEFQQPRLPASSPAVHALYRMTNSNLSSSQKESTPEDVPWGLPGRPMYATTSPLPPRVAWPEIR